METLNNFYKVCALNSAKNTPTVQTLEEKRRENVNKQISYMEKQLQTMYPDQDELVDKLLKQEVEKIDFGSSTIDVTDTSKVKTLEEFINESIEKDRLVVVEIGESLQELIQTAPKEDVKYLQENEEEVQETYEIPEPDEIPESDEILEQEDKEEQLNNDEKDFIEPKYFVIQIGNEEEQKYIVIDKDGSEVGKIEDGQFEMNEEYFDSKLEKFNIDDFISAKVHNIQEVERIKQELKPKTLEQLAEMNLDSGKEIVKKTEKIIEGPEKEIEPQEEEKGILDKTDKEKDIVDEEYEKEADNEETVDKILEEKDSKNIKEKLDEKCSRKLVILIPYTLTDQLDNHGLKEKGEEITVYQFPSGLDDIDTPRFVLLQGNRVVDGTKMGCNEQIQKNMSRIPYTSGVVKEVSDEETKAQVTLADGTEKEFLIKGEPHDINFDDKEFVKSKLAELSAELNRIRSITQDDMTDYIIEFPRGPEQQAEMIDYYESEIFKICNEYGIEVPADIKIAAQEKTDSESLTEKTTDENVKTPYANYTEGRIPNNPNQYN